MRRLVERGLAEDASDSKQSLRPTSTEKLIIHMLAEMMKAQKIKADIDPQFVEKALWRGHLWALEWEYPGIFHGHVDQESSVREVGEILNMWDFMESSYEKFSAKQKERIRKEAEPFGRDVQFRGFDGNNETEHMGIARFLVEEMERFSRFKGRDFNSHVPSLDAYRRMLRVFAPKGEGFAGRSLSDSKVIELLNEMIHPDNREK